MDNTAIEIKDRDGKRTVSARELHEKLGIKTKFKDWFPRMCEYGFEENIDYVTVAQKRATVQGNAYEFNEYFISLDMAKEICMIQRSEIGRKFRQYFIECEKELNTTKNLAPIDRTKSKQIRNMFTDTLHNHGYEKPHEYIQTTLQMKKALGINAKKSDMDLRQLAMVGAGELLAVATIGDEHGYHEVNLVCVDASKAVAGYVENRMFTKNLLSK